MQIKSIAITCLLVPAFWVVMSVTCFASSICWIDRIAAAKGGLDVYFIQEASLRIIVRDSADGTSARYAASNGIVHDDEDGHAQDHLFVKDGVEFSAWQSIEDSCTYRLV